MLEGAPPDCHDAADADAFTRQRSIDRRTTARALDTRRVVHAGSSRVPLREQIDTKPGVVGIGDRAEAAGQSTPGTE